MANQYLYQIGHWVWTTKLAFWVKIVIACSYRKKRSSALKLFVCHQGPKRPTKKLQTLLLNDVMILSKTKRTQSNTEILLVEKYP